ncbi:prepilin-type N-terminal cleavage/methylation domain-containing protein [Cellvibrio sp.]
MMSLSAALSYGSLATKARLAPYFNKSDKANAYSNNQAHGFTLLEILVVLVLVGLVGSLVMQGFSFTINLQDRLKRQLINNQIHDLQEIWFRQVTRSFIETAPNENQAAFRGTSTTITGTALMDLTGNVGIPTNTSWHVENTEHGQQLSYTSESVPKTIVANWDTNDLRFQFLGHDGELYDKWPSNPGDKNIPKGILLSSSSEEPVFWYISVSNTRAPPVETYEFN